MKQRLDALLVARGLCDTRSRAQARIMAGEVYVDGQKRDKPGERHACDSTIELKGPNNPFVSRGGLKLLGAIEHFGLDVENKVCLDVGASTGGFTDCLLQSGASRVYAVDVGRGQLHWQLRQNPRVICLEGVNARYLQPADIAEQAQLAVVDVSFISLELILPVLMSLISDDAEAVCLVKPQFEAGRRQVGKQGVVRDPEVHVAVLQKLLAGASNMGWQFKGLTHSPLRGPKGNIEFWVWLHKSQATPDEASGPDRATCEQVVATAHSVLKQEG